MSDDETILAPETASIPPGFEGVPRVGERLAGKYEIEALIGTGGMGVVVAAKNINLGERVAIKFLLPRALRDKEVVARFVREARTAVRIKSEHVARVIDIGTLESTGAPYIVMEHLEGTDLADLMKAGPLSIVDVLDYVLQACVALAEAHAHGIVHRDLKPSNLFLTARSDGTPLVKVLDFGISKAIDIEMHGRPNSDLTDTSAVFGTPAYMSPEQVRSAKNVDPRSDVWSLGVILFELLSRTCPFKAETSAGTLAAVAADEPPSLRDLREEVPGELEHVIMRALRKDPAKRYQSIAELAEALEPFTPEGKRLVQRIERLSTTGSNGSGRLLPAARSSGAPVARTEPSWVTPAGTRRKTLSARAMVLGVVAAAVVLAVLQQGASRSPAVAPPAPTSAASPEVPIPSASTSPSRPAVHVPLPGAEVAPAATGAVYAADASVAAVPRRPLRPAPLLSPASVSPPSAPPPPPPTATAPPRDPFGESH